MNAATLDVTLPDGSVRTLPAGSTGLDLAQSIGSRLAKAAIAAMVNGQEVDISRVPTIPTGKIGQSSFIANRAAPVFPLY
ncbi:MAG: TGS domain-containing protein, partial [Actinomycetes bacterium]